MRVLSFRRRRAATAARTRLKGALRLHSPWSRRVATAAALICAPISTKALAAGGIPRLPGLSGAVAQDVTVEGARTYSFYPDADPTQKILYILPRSLKIARDDQGAARAQIDLTRSLDDPRGVKPDGRTARAGGIASLVVCVGEDNRASAVDSIRRAIDRQYPQYQDYEIRTIMFKPGSGQVGFQVGDSSAPFSVMPSAAPTTIGSQIPAIIPISAEAGETILRRLERGQTGSQSLKVNVRYEATATFALDPITLWVKADRKAVYHYMHEIIRASGGFFILSFSYHKEKIVETLRKEGKLDSGIRGLSREQLANLPDAYKSMLKDMEQRAVDFLIGIDVDKTGKLAPAEFERREGRISLFAPCFWWSFNAWAGGAYGKVEIDREASGLYEDTKTFESTVDLPVTLLLDGFDLPRDAVQVVDFDTAYSTSQEISVNPFDPNRVPDLWQHWLTSAHLTVAAGDPDKPIYSRAFVFNSANPGILSQRMYLQSQYEPIGNGFFRPVVPPLTITGEVIAEGARVPIGPVAVQRSNTSLYGVSINLRDYVNLLVFDGSAFFESETKNPTDIRTVEIEVKGRDNNIHVLELKPNRRIGVSLVANAPSSALGATYRVRAQTRRNWGGWGPDRALSGRRNISLSQEDLGSTR